MESTFAKLIWWVGTLFELKVNLACQKTILTFYEYEEFFTYSRLPVTVVAVSCQNALTIFMPNWTLTFLFVQSSHFEFCCFLHESLTRETMRVVDSEYSYPTHISHWRNSHNSLLKLDVWFGFGFSKNEKLSDQFY